MNVPLVGSEDLFPLGLADWSLSLFRSVTFTLRFLLFILVA